MTGILPACLKYSVAVSLLVEEVITTIKDLVTRLSLILSSRSIFEEHTTLIRSPASDQKTNSPVPKSV